MIVKPTYEKMEQKISLLEESLPMAKKPKRETLKRVIQSIKR
jgi:hypothetical protein